VLDLKRVAGNPDLVVPFKPEESKLWTLIRDDEMPPQDAKGGPLAREEKEVIRAWVASGAPAASSPSLPGPTLPATHPLELSAVKRLFRWLGRFHIPAVHFPIALLAAAALGEVWAAWRAVRIPESAVRFGVLLGAGGAVFAATLGWLHADLGGYGSADSQVLSLHRWIGTTAALWAVGIALLSERDARRQQRSTCFRIMLWFGAVLAAAAGHLGGTLVHGEGFFNW
jgi:hypothetical protein